MTDYRKRLEAVAADLAKYDDDCTLARAYGGPTMLPRHPIDERRASQIGADLRSLLSEADSLRADIAGLEDGNMTFLCDELDKAKAENARMREALRQIADGSAPPIPHGHYLAHRRAVDVARVALSVKAG